MSCDSNKYIIEIKEPITLGLNHEETIERLNKLKGCLYMALSDEIRDGIPYTLIFVYYEHAKKDSSIKNKLKVDDKDCLIKVNSRTCRKNKDFVFRQGDYKKYRKQYNICSQTEWGQLPTNEIPEHHSEYKVLHNGIQVLNYSHQRIKQILRDDYNNDLIVNWSGYKGNRKPNFVETYKLIDNTSKSVVIEKATLDAFRYIFTNKGYSLKA